VLVLVREPVLGARVSVQALELAQVLEPEQAVLVPEQPVRARVRALGPVRGQEPVLVPMAEQAVRLVRALEPEWVLLATNQKSTSTDSPGREQTESQHRRGTIEGP